MLHAGSEWLRSDDEVDTAKQPTNATQACATLSGETIGGATLAAVAVPSSSAVPAYCKVNGTLAPKLNFETRMPDVWNGKLHYAGGGYNGAIPDLAFSLSALKQGYATVSSDSGQQGSPVDASFALTDTNAAQLFGSLSVPTVIRQWGSRSSDRARLRRARRRRC